MSNKLADEIIDSAFGSAVAEGWGTYISMNIDANAFLFAMQRDEFIHTELRKLIFDYNLTFAKQLASIKDCVKLGTHEPIFFCDCTRLEDDAIDRIKNGCFILRQSNSRKCGLLSRRSFSSNR